MRWIYLYNNEDDDYSSLNGCGSLLTVCLTNSKFSSIDDISENDYLHEIMLANTPVIEKEEQLEKLSKFAYLDILILDDGDDYKLVSLASLKNIKHLDYISLKNCHLTDYSVLKDCKISKLDLQNSQISKADDIIGMEEADAINVKDTPISQNPEELNKLKDAYPDADIMY